MANTSHERYGVALSLMLCAGLCICLAMVLLLLLWIVRHYCPVRRAITLIEKDFPMPFVETPSRSV